jgi:hypothetical protein
VTPDKDKPIEAGLVTNTVRRAVPPGAIDDGENALFTEIPLTTVILADALLVLLTMPTDVFADTLPIAMVLVDVPVAEGAMMLTFIVQLDAAAIEVPVEAPDNITEFAPGAAAMLPDPQVVVALGTGATKYPLGKGSVTVKLLYNAAFAGRDIVIVSSVTAPATTGFGAKLFVTLIGLVMVRRAVNEAILLPSDVCRPLTATVLVRLPIADVIPASTGTVIIQLPAVETLGATGILPPLNVILVEPDTAVNVPPQVLVAAGLVATVNPVPIEVRASVKLVILAAPLVERFCNVIVNMETADRGTLAGLNDFTPVTDDTCNVPEVELKATPDRLPAGTLLT